MSNLFYLTLVPGGQWTKGYKNTASKNIYSPSALELIEEIEEWLWKIETLKCANGLGREETRIKCFPFTPK